MKQQISIFEDARFGQIRTATTEGGEPLFCLADVCRVLGLTNARAVKTTLLQRYVTTIDVSTPVISQGINTGKTKTMSLNFITEPNLYKCISDSFSAVSLAISEIITTFANAYYIHRHSILRHINNFRRIARHIKDYSPERSSWAKAVTAYSREDVCGTQTLTGDFYFC